MNRTEQGTPESACHFVLVHGGRHGGWCWRDVARMLRAAGHEVLTPTLTGLGERRHLLGPDIGLSTHVQDLVSVVEHEDLDDVVLVAHSYAGIVCNDAMARIADRVRTLVYLDAHVPRSGESMFDIIGPEAAAARVAAAAAGGDGWLIPPGDASYWGVTDPVQRAWVNGKTSPQPLRTYQDRVVDADRAWAHPGMYIQCTPSAMPPHVLDRPRQRSANDADFHYRVIDAPHDAMVTAPAALVDLLLEAARLADRSARRAPRGLAGTAARVSSPSSRVSPGGARRSG